MNHILKDCKNKLFTVVITADEELFNFFPLYCTLRVAQEFSLQRTMVIGDLHGEG